MRIEIITKTPQKIAKVSSNLLTTTTCVPEVFFYRLNKMENNSAGNTVSRRRAASGKLPFLMFCDKEILYHGFLCFTTIMVTVTQATVLNFFIIAFFRGYYHQVSLGKKKILLNFFDVVFLTYFWEVWQSVKKFRQIETFNSVVCTLFKKSNFLSKNSISREIKVVNS